METVAYYHGSNDRTSVLKTAFLITVLLVSMGMSAATDLNNIESITPAGSTPITITGEVDMNGNPITGFFGSQCNSGNVAAHVNNDGTLDCVDATSEVQNDFVNRNGDTMTGTLDMQSNTIINAGSGNIDIGDGSGNINFHSGGSLISVEGLNVDHIDSNKGSDPVDMDQGMDMDGSNIIDDSDNEVNINDDLQISQTLIVDGGTECSGDQFIAGDGSCNNDDAAGYTYVGGDKPSSPKKGDTWLKYNILDKSEMVEIWNKSISGDIYTTTVKDGHLYYDKSSNLVKAKPDGETLWTYTGHTKYISDISVDDDGYIYTASGDNTVRKISPDGDLVCQYDTGSNAWEVTVEPDGSYFYQGGEGGDVRKFDPNCNLVDTLDTLNNGVMGLEYASGHLYAAGGETKKFNTDGTIDWTYSTGRRLGVAPNGDVYTNRDYNWGLDSEIIKLNGSTGNKLWGQKGYGTSYQIKTLKNGNILHVSRLDRKVTELDSDGNLVWTKVSVGLRDVGIGDGSYYLLHEPTINDIIKYTDPKVKRYTGQRFATAMDSSESFVTDIDLNGNAISGADWSNANGLNSNGQVVNTKCSGNDYLAGDGTCNADSYEANTDSQQLGVSGNQITLGNGGSVTAPYADNAGDADTLDGKHASAFSKSLEMFAKVHNVGAGDSGGTASNTWYYSGDVSITRLKVYQDKGVERAETTLHFDDGTSKTYSWGATGDTGTNRYVRHDTAWDGKTVSHVEVYSEDDNYYTGGADVTAYLNGVRLY